MFEEKTTSDSDYTLMQRLAHQDERAMSEAYDRFSSVIYSIACRVLRPGQEAEDVVQEVFIKIWKQANRYQSDSGTPLGWIITMTRNQAIDKLRSLQRRSAILQDTYDEMPEVAESTAHSGSHSLVNDEKKKLVQVALKTLPQDQKKAIELAFFSGLTQLEIAEHLQEPLGTIKARIRRGMLKLRAPLMNLQEI